MKNFSYIPSKPLTFDLIETLDLFFRRACYHWNVSYRKMKRIRVVENVRSTNSVLFIFLYMIHPQKLQSLQEKVQSFQEVQEAFTVSRHLLTRYNISRCDKH
jgi:hypothetical protein